MCSKTTFLPAMICLPFSLDSRKVKQFLGLLRTQSHDYYNLSISYDVMLTI